MFVPAFLFALVLCAFAAIIAVPQEIAHGRAHHAAFDQFRSSPANGKAPPRTAKRCSSYELISNGSVLMERLHPGNEPDMIPCTRLMATASS